ncbi:hypothetical protein [Trueperella sp.]|uniref:hypothetical protein n=1 Tax=Trueperella sp. TaxID=2699835 RepID=UPI0026079D36|nr:hypothetical protein [Trueperella sp.]
MESNMPLWEFIGWAGSVLVIVSLMVPSIRRFRVLNLAGSLIATIYNIYFGIWPYAAMNGVIVLIDAYWLWRLTRDRDEERGYCVLEVDAAAALPARFLDRHLPAITKAFPHFDREALSGAHVFLTLHEDEVIGLFALSADGDTGHILIDYVTERFRDLTPGTFLYNNAELFARLTLTSVTLPVRDAADPMYFAKQGFTTRGDLLVREV